MGIIPANEESRAVFKNDFLSLAQSAFELQGNAAFTNPRSAAIAHETGHAMVFASEGMPLRYVKVWPIKRSETRKAIKTRHPGLEDVRMEKVANWIGVTVPINNEEFSVSPFTPPALALYHARTTIAGWVGEMLFDRSNFRLGSSLDEIAVVRQLAYTVSLKLGLPMEQVMMEYIMLPVFNLLRAHEEVAAELISYLRRHGSIRGRKLAKVLSGVSRLV
jgi:hypothetical protein